MGRTGEAHRQEAILRAIGETGCLTTAELATLLDRPSKQVATTTCALVLQDYLERVERGCFCLADKGRAWLESGKRLKSGRRGLTKKGPHPRRSIRQRVWNAMRIKGKFTYDDLCLLAAADGSQPKEAIRKYIIALKQAGYVVELHDRADDGKVTSNGLKLFRLIKNTGDLAPAVLRSGDLVDRNEKEAA